MAYTVDFTDGTKPSITVTNAGVDTSTNIALVGQGYTSYGEVVAEDELDDINVELDAMIAAKEMDIDHAEAVLRVELGSKVSSLSSKGFFKSALAFSYPSLVSAIS